MILFPKVLLTTFQHQRRKVEKEMKLLISITDIYSMLPTHNAYVRYTKHQYLQEVHLLATPDHDLLIQVKIG
jgi:hypothetical protein